jgi:hypothetical protein
MPGHFTTLWELWSTSIPSGQWRERLLGTSTKLGLKVLTLKTIEMIFPECVELVTAIQSVSQLTEFSLEPVQYVQGAVICGT